MEKIILFVAILIMIFSISTGQIAAQNNNFELGIEQMEGETQYEIYGSDWASELIFPLDSSILEFTYERQNFSIEGRDLYLKYGQTFNDQNISGFEDSDWLNNNSTKDIYSTGDVDLDGKTFDIGLRYHKEINQRSKLTALMGYQIIKYDFDVHSAVNHYGGSAGEINNGDTVLLYESEYNIPYIGGSYERKVSNSFNLTGTLKWSPISDVEDEDDHILRNKIANSEADGNTYILKVNTEYEINNNWQAYLKAKYLYSDLSGSQSQYWYGDDPATPNQDDTGTRIDGINYENKQQISSFGFGFNYKF